MANTKSPSRKRKQAANAGAGAGNSQLEKFIIDALKDIYWAEKALTKALPKMKRAVTTPELQDAFEHHLEQTEDQVARLEQVFSFRQKSAG